MDYVLKPSALRQLKKLPPDLRRRIVKKLDYYCAQSDPLQYAEPLTRFDIGSYRFRVGDYRIIIDLDNDIVVVLLIGHRREIYR